MANRGKRTKTRPQRIPTSTQKRLKNSKPRRVIHSSHKVRSELFRDSTTYPLRDRSADKVAYERRRAKRQLSSHPTAGRWNLIGPTNIGGRMTCAVTNPTDADEIWAGAAGGGVWYSADAGRSWKPLWHRQDTLNVGSIAIDPKNPKVLYCGTGEANLSADSYAGVGLYKTIDGGKTWRLIARAIRGGLPTRIGTIAVDPRNPNHIWLGGVGHTYPTEPRGAMGGLYESKNAGKTWKRHDFVSKEEYRCHSIVIHPTRPSTVYATVTEQGARNGIWRTKNGGKTWVHLTKGLPDPSLIERTSLAIATSKPSVIYAIAADSESGVLGVFRTSNGGNTWKAIHNRPASDSDTHGKAFHYWRRSQDEIYEGQMEYGNSIAVSPTDENHVLCGGVDLHLTTDGGDKWKLATRWNHSRGKSDYAHADHHALLMPKGAPGRIYDLNDGGMDVSDDGGVTWTNRSSGLAVTMYYDLDVAQGDSRYFGGGAQDNGTPMTFTGAADDHEDMTTGDGGWAVFDPRDKDHIYTSIYNMNIFRWPHSDPTKESFEDVSPEATDREKELTWMCFIAMDPASSKRLFTGSWRVWRTVNDGKKWRFVSPDFNDIITAIEISRADSKYVYIGTRSGAIHLSTDGGSSWSGDLSGATVPNLKISRIKTSPTNAKHVIAVVANFGVSHVFRSEDAGRTWEDIDCGRLPDVPHHSIAIPTRHGKEVYVANDAGVWVSPDFGSTWRDLTGHLPNVGIVDIVYHDADDLLTAATYGRSIWQIEIR